MKTSAALSEKLPPGAWKIIAVVILGPFITQMDSTIVNVSLSSIRRDLHSTISSAHWIISGYLLALALMLPLNAWLVARLGAKKLYLICFSSFTLASALCGMAATMPELIGARIIQGIAGGLLAPLTQFMMARVVGRQMARVIGFATVPILVAPLAGPVLAGIILKYAGWPWLFYVNVPVGILAVILAAYIIPPDDAEMLQRPFDLPGFLIISPALPGLLYGLDRVSHRQDGWSLILSLVLIGGFIWHAIRKKADALIDLELFKIRTFSAAAITMFLANGIMYGGQFLIPLFLTSGCHLTATQAGWILSAMGIGMLCSYPSMGYLTEKFGCRAVASSGVFLNFLGTVPFLCMAVTGFSMKLALIGLFVRGAGQGATGIPAISAAYAAVPKETLNIAAMSVNIVQRLGGPVITTAIAIATSLSADVPMASSHAFVAPFAALLTVQLFGLASASRLPLRIEPVGSVEALKG
ncbi:MAG TPA: DHA2 family efflux MFS transporter permease subunit [Candidatus Sulfotelmatobacter sp.]|nr:DHA2 family efflux MFS transporter permease subunit [Candidatus Sulfotelmatobacter sp.]